MAMPLPSSTGDAEDKESQVIKAARAMLSCHLEHYTVGLPFDGALSLSPLITKHKDPEVFILRRLRAV